MQKFLVSFFILFAGLLNVQANDSFRSDDAAFYTELQQQVKISGTVIDNNTNEPLPGVTIVVEGTTKGVFTDNNGKYTIDVPGPAAVLVFTYIGYKSERVEIAGRVVVDVSMSDFATNLDEVVVIGYGTRQKKDITTAVSTISTKDLENLTSSTAEMAMQGKMAGVYVASGGNTAASRPTIQIRGMNSWQVTSPLYVVDGVPVYEYGAGTEGLNNFGVQDIRSPINIMSLINPDDIESISVLKDASASAIYGVRAANGVILITTKKGKAGKTNIEFSMSRSWQNLPKTYDVLTTPQFVDLYQEAHDNNPSVPLPAEFDPSSPTYLGNGLTYDWQTPYLNKNATVDNYSLRVSGATEKMDYYFSVGYDNNESVFIENNMKRYSLATNLNTRINKYFTAGINYRLSYADALDNNYNSNGRANLGHLAQYSPWQPIYDTEGTYAALKLNGYMPATQLYTPAGVYSPSFLWGQQTTYNTFGIFSTQLQDFKILRNMGTGYVEFKPIEGLSIKGSVSMDIYSNHRRNWSDNKQNWFLQTPADPVLLADPALANDTKGRYGQIRTLNYNIISEFTVNYNKTFGKHSFDILFSAMNQSTKFEYMAGSTQWVQSADPHYWKVGGEDKYTGASSFWEEGVLQGYLGRINYKYSNKYYLDFTLRRDGSANFAKENRWGWFPGVSAAWRVSDESFMQGLSFITDLKLRVGWGQLGNQETQKFPYLSAVSQSGNYSFGSYTADPFGNRYLFMSLPSFPNKDLVWEKLISQNYALEAVLLNNIDFTFEYYHKITDGILQITNIPASVGSRNPPVANVAKVKNAGIELSMGYRNMIGDLNFHISGNLTTNTNEVLEMYGGNPLNAYADGNLRIEEGYPINYIRGFKTDGIIQNQTQLDEYLDRLSFDDRRNNALTRPGDYMFQSVNGDTLINNSDLTNLGSTLPGLFYGLTVDLSYKGFDFNMHFQGVGDIKKIAYHRIGFESMSAPGDNQFATTLDRWTTENPSNSMPRAAQNDPAGNNRISDRWVEGAGFLRMAHMELGYSLPGSVLNFLKISTGLRVFVASNNMFTITNWSGLDPENEYSPTARTFMAGLKASF